MVQVLWPPKKPEECLYINKTTLRKEGKKPHNMLFAAAAETRKMKGREYSGGCAMPCKLQLYISRERGDFAEAPVRGRLKLTE